MALDPDSCLHVLVQACCRHTADYTRELWEQMHEEGCPSWVPIQSKQRGGKEGCNRVQAELDHFDQKMLPELGPGELEVSCSRLALFVCFTISQMHLKSRAGAVCGTSQL